MNMYKVSVVIFIEAEDKDDASLKGVKIIRDNFINNNDVIRVEVVDLIPVDEDEE